MATRLKIIVVIFGWLGLFMLPITVSAVPVSKSSYVLGDSIAYGLHLDGLEAKLQDQLGGPVRISFDGGRCITTPGNQIHQSALDSVDADQKFIATAGVVVIVLGMNQQETSFEESQKALIQKLKAIAPKASYYWVDIGATIATQVPGWNARNRAIYNNAPRLGYRVISRYKAIFGPLADPLNLEAGKNFADWPTEAGYGAAGNIHGFYTQLSQAIVRATSAPSSTTACAAGRVAWSSYVLGDSIVYGLQLDGLDAKLEAKLGGVSRLSYDVGRSITTPGVQIKKSALESVELDRTVIARARVIIISLGTNQLEASFAESQQVLMQKLKTIAPDAQYFWIDIGATISTQADGWSARNRLIYEQASRLGYKVISRYQAIFGPKADPLNIQPGQIFPGTVSEPGYDGPGNVHGAYSVLSQAVLDAMPENNASVVNDALRYYSEPCTKP